LTLLDLKETEKLFGQIKSEFSILSLTTKWYIDWFGKIHDCICRDQEFRG